MFNLKIWHSSLRVDVGIHCKYIYVYPFWTTQQWEGSMQGSSVTPISLWCQNRCTSQHTSTYGPLWHHVAAWWIHVDVVFTSLFSLTVSILKTFDVSFFCKCTNAQEHSLKYENMFIPYANVYFTFQYLSLSAFMLFQFHFCHCMLK